MRKFIGFLTSLFLGLNCFPQQFGWNNFNNGQTIYSITSEGKYIWCGTNGGAIKIDTLTWEKEFFNMANSGLPDNEVRSVAIDSQGRKWFGTIDGLAIFDNTSWQVYNTQNSGLTQNNITSVITMTNGEVWIGTQDSGLVNFSNQNWVSYNTNNSDLPNNRIYFLNRKNDGSLLVGTRNGAVILRDGNWRIIDYTDWTPGDVNCVTSIVPEGDSLVWFGTLYGLFCVTDPNPGGNYYVPFFDSVPDRIYGISVDSKGNKWIAADDGLYVFDGETWPRFTKSTSGIPGDFVRRVYADALDNIWTFTYHDLFYQEPKDLVRYNGSEWLSLNTSDSPLLQNKINALSVDPGGNIWIGLQNEYAVYSYPDHNWRSDKFYDNYNTTLYPSCFAFDNLGRTWMGVYYEGIRILDGTSCIYINEANSQLPDNKIECITFDSLGNAWIGTHSGACYFDGNSWQVFNKSNSPLPSNIINAVTIDKQGIVWLSTNEGIASFNGSSWILYNSVNSPLPNNVVECAAIGPDGLKWFGCWDGLVSFNGTDWTVYNPQNSGLPYGHVTSILAESDGSLWVGTLYCYLTLVRQDEWTPFNFLYSDSYDEKINNIVKSPDGHIWVATSNKGLFEFNENSLAIDPVTDINDCIIYPNPVSSNLLLDFPAELNGQNKNLMVFSSQGKLILSKVISKMQNTWSENLSYLPAGTYFFRVTSEQLNSYRMKFIKIQ